MKKISILAVVVFGFSVLLAQGAEIRFRNIPWGSAPEDVRSVLVRPDGESLYEGCSVRLVFGGGGLVLAELTYAVSGWDDLYRGMSDLHTRVFGPPIEGMSPGSGTPPALLWHDSFGNSLRLSVPDGSVHVLFHGAPRVVDFD